MGTQVDDLRPTSHSADTFFAERSLAGAMDDADLQLIRDSNEQALRNMEATRKNRAYERSQTTEKKKAPAMNMDQVDWSGFPGAAHQRSPGGGDRKDRKMGRRSSLNSKKSPGEPERRPIKPRSMRRMSMDGATSVSTGLSPPQSPRSPTSRKYRHRRREAKVSGPSTPKEGDTMTSPDFDRKKRRDHLKESLSNARTERQASGVTRAQRRSASGSRSKSRSRRNQQPKKPQSTSPSRRSSRVQRSSSPNARLRRPVAAAASSTTLEVPAHSGRRGRQRHNSFNRRKKSTERPSQSEEKLKKATSLRW